jgi:predicted  nucleic acid-binding Zn-ribbon protein
MPNDLHRLDRIEAKIDKLSDALIAIARTEEKLIQMELKNSANYDRMNKFSQKLDDIEKSVADNAATVGLINKLFWVAVVAISGSIAAQLWM